MSSSSTKIAFERMAASLGGTLSSADEVEPSVCFRWSGFELRLSIVHDLGAPPRTGLVMALPSDPPLEIDLYPQRTMFNVVRRVIPLQDIVVGDEAFDRSFVVKGSDSQRVIELFSPPERAALLALTQLGEGGFATVYTTFHAVVVAVAGHVDDVQKLQALAAHARTILEGYVRVTRLAPSPGA